MKSGSANAGRTAEAATASPRAVAATAPSPNSSRRSSCKRRPASSTTRETISPRACTATPRRASAHMRNRVAAFPHSCRHGTAADNVRGGSVQVRAAPDAMSCPWIAEILTMRGEWTHLEEREHKKGEDHDDEGHCNDRDDSA